ncbi:MAG: YraN family protein [Rickettsiaceae bacterium H1]|nr:YraN family protein [Rickettsiaceae bacterium H1]
MIIPNRKKLAYFFGYFAEIFVIIFLFFLSYRVLHYRYRNFYGEIDIIAARKNSILFIEVKARKSKELCADLLSCKQKKRIKKAANYFLAINSKKYQNFSPYFLFCCFSFFSFRKSYF